MDRTADSPEPDDPDAAARSGVLMLLRDPKGFGERTRIPMSYLPDGWRALIPAGRTWVAANGPSKKQLSLASFMMLGASDAAAMSGRFSRMSTGILGAGAGIGLILTSAYDMRRADVPPTSWMPRATWPGATKESSRSLRRR